MATQENKQNKFPRKMIPLMISFQKCAHAPSYMNKSMVGKVHKN